MVKTKPPFPYEDQTIHTCMYSFSSLNCIKYFCLFSDFQQQQQNQFVEISFAIQNSFFLALCLAWKRLFSPFQ